MMSMTGNLSHEYKNISILFDKYNKFGQHYCLVKDCYLMSLVIEITPCFCNFQTPISDFADQGVQQCTEHNIVW